MTVPLNWLSQRMLGLQGPDRPWTILFGVHLRTPVRRDEVASAWRTLCAARPELSVVLDDRFRWAPVAPAEPSIGATEPVLDRAMRPGVDQPVTIVLDADPATTIRFVVNHAHADGMGVLGMAEDLLRTLAGTAIAARAAMDDTHLDALRTRRPALRAAGSQVPPRRVAERPHRPDAATRLDIVDIELSPLTARRKARGLSVSSFLIDAVHRALRDDPCVRGRVALGVPADLRRHVGDPTGIGNGVVNLTFAPTSEPTLDDIDTFLREEAATQRLGESLSWIHRVGRPRLPRATPRPGRAVATAMLSNLGLVTGDAWDQARSLELVAPAHQTTSVGFIAAHDTLTITVRSRGGVPGLADAIASALR